MRSGTGKPPKRLRAASTVSAENTGWVSTKSAPAAIFFSRIRNSRSMSAAPIPNAQPTLNVVACSIDRPVISTPEFKALIIRIDPDAVMSETDVALGKSPVLGRSPMTANTLRRPRAWAPIKSECSATRFRWRSATCMMVSRPRRLWMILAIASALIRLWARGLSATLMASTRPDSLRGLSASRTGATSNPFGGSTSTVTTNFLPSFLDRFVGSATLCGAARSRVPFGAGFEGIREPGRCTPTRASRMAAMCSGDVPQHPPTRVAPASTILRAYCATYSGDERYMRRPPW